MRCSRGTRSLLRRRQGALGAALTRSTAADQELTRTFASQDATAGFARAAGRHGEAAIPASVARAPAVAAVLALALCCVSPAWGDSGTPPATTPTSTTPDAPPPDPYKPPAKTSTSKPRQTRPAVVQAAPVYHAPVRTYTPPAPVVRTPTYRPQHTASVKRAKAVHRRKARVVHRHVAPKPKPVKVTFNPFANLVAASSVLSAAEGTSDRDRYLQLAGIAFALLAAAGLSFHTLAVRAVK
jgi:hypothetical protein